MQFILSILIIILSISLVDGKTELHTHSSYVTRKPLLKHHNGSDHLINQTASKPTATAHHKQTIKLSRIPIAFTAISKPASSIITNVHIDTNLAGNQTLNKLPTIQNFTDAARNLMISANSHDFTVNKLNFLKSLIKLYYARKYSIKSRSTADIFSGHESSYVTTLTELNKSLNTLLDRLSFEEYDKDESAIDSRQNIIFEHTHQPNISAMLNRLSILNVTSQSALKLDNLAQDLKEMKNWLSLIFVGKLNDTPSVIASNAGYSEAANTNVGNSTKSNIQLPPVFIEHNVTVSQPALANHSESVQIDSTSTTTSPTLVDAINSEGKEDLITIVPESHLYEATVVDADAITNKNLNGTAVEISLDPAYYLEYIKILSKMLTELDQYRAFGKNVTDF